MLATIPCGVCGAGFLPKMRSQKYCSRLCYSRAWSHNNPEKCREKSIKRRKAKPEWYAAHEPGYYRNYRAKVFSLRPWKYLVSSRRQDAEKRKLPFDLTDEWGAARWTGRCEITGIKFRANGKRGPHPFSPSLDRIEPNKGYTQDNCRFILWGCNAIKGVGTDTDMYEIAAAIVANKPI